LIYYIYEKLVNKICLVKLEKDTLKLLKKSKTIKIANRNEII
jgi:hypothetical protein